jgi:large subunit ribosomal protein L22
MAQVTAKLNNYRQSPRKVRLVANFVKGRSVSDAIAQLTLLPKRAAGPVMKLVSSAVANAKQAGYSEDQLTVENLTVDKGAIMYRRRARARGRAMPIRKRTSHLMVTLKAPDAAEKKEVKKLPAKKAAAKPAAKKAAPAKKAPAKKAVAKKAPAKKVVKKETK